MSHHPAELQYTKDHEWVKIEHRTAFIGVTAHALCQLGDIVYLDLAKEGTMLRAGETFGVIESTKTVSDLYMPVSGKILQINQTLVDSPETLTAHHAYQEGWLLQVELAEPNQSAEHPLMDAAAYEKYLQGLGG